MQPSEPPKKNKLELLPDDDVFDISAGPVDAGTKNDKSLKVSCMECSIVGPYKSEDQTMKAKGKRPEVTFQIMRMTECGHGIVFGVMTSDVKASISEAQRLQKRFMQLAQSGDQSGAQRTFRKLNREVQRVKNRQRTAWQKNQHRIELDAIPELTDAA